MNTSEKTCKTCIHFITRFDEERCEYPMSIIQACLYSEGNYYYKRKDDVSNNKSVLSTTE